MWLLILIRVGSSIATGIILNLILPSEIDVDTYVYTMNNAKDECKDSLR